MVQSGTAYGGEDVSALVLEVGSHWTKAGYAGEDTPRSVFSTAYGRFAESEDASSAMDVDGEAGSSSSSGLRFGESTMLFREGMTIGNPLGSDGLVSDWDAYQQLWTHALRNQLRLDPKEHPLLFSEPPHNTKEQREKLAQMAFETFEVPAFFLARSPVLAGFAAGRSTALIVDIGASSMTVAPVYDGYVLNKAVMAQPLAGQKLSENALAILKETRNYEPIPRFRIAKKKAVEMGKPAEPALRKLNHIHPSFEAAAKLRIADDFKENVGEVSEYRFNQEVLAMRPQKAFEFPDGYHSNFGTERFRITEALFNPEEFLAPSVSATEDEQLVGIQQLIMNSLDACDVDARPSFLNSIVLTGGTTLLPTFADRLNNELTTLLPGMKVKIYSPGNSMERRFGNWIGGSVLGSLGSFQQMWVSKQEYEEHGANIIEKRCQ